MLGRKEVKGLLLLGLEKVPHGFGLTGGCDGDTADGVGNQELPDPRTSTCFPEIWSPALGRGRRKDCVHLWVF